MYVYPRIHLWMLFPFVIAIAGFYFTYWSVFTTVPFHQHVHGMTATLWFGLLIVQPLLIRRGDREMHRKVGIVGLVLAGGVVFSALQIVENNMANPNLDSLLRYGLTWGDFLFLTGFAHAVVAAMLNSKEPAVHARYMIASAFWALMPAFARLIYYPMVIVAGYPAPISFEQVVYLCVAIELVAFALLMLLDYRRERKIYRPYVLLAAGTLLFGLTMRPMAQAEWWIRLCDALLT